MEQFLSRNIFKWFTCFISDIESSSDKCNRWFKQFPIILSGKLSNNFVATPDFLPTIVLAPSGQNAIKFAFKYSLVKPHHLKYSITSSIEIHPTVAETSSFKVTNNVAGAGTDYTVHWT